VFQLIASWPVEQRVLGLLQAGSDFGQAPSKILSGTDPFIASFVGAEPVRFSERHFDLIVEPLNDTTGNRFLDDVGGVDARWFPGRRRVSRVSWKVCIELQPMFEVTRDDNKGDSTSRACAGILRLAFGRG
jgi:hypothetical protein